MNNKKDNEFLDHLIKTGSGKILTDEFFKLPSELDFYADDWNISQFNKLTGADITSSFFLEAPPYLENGYYQKDKVFIVRSNPIIPGLTSDDDDSKENGREAKATNRYDADTIYYETKSLNDGNAKSSFYIGDVYYESFKDYISSGDTNSSNFGIRFLGINAGEIPHMVIVPARAEDTSHEYTFKIKDIVNKNNFSYLREHDETNDEVTFYYSPEEDIYCEILDEKYEYKYKNKKKDDYGNEMKYYIVVSVDSSEKETLSESLKAKETLEYILKSASDSLIMVDQKSLTRKSDRYESPYDVDFLHEDYGPVRGLAAMLKRTWSSFFGEERYYSFGFTPPGTDNNRRCLGAVYVKIHPRFLSMDVSTINNDLIDKSTGEVWINLNKYLLYTHRSAIEALPDYKSNPLHSYHQGFASSAFKLWSYDIDNKENLDKFYAYTSEFVKERNEFFETITGFNMDDMLEYYMVLGDTVMLVPPTSIRCTTQIANEKVPLLRSKGSTIKTAPRSERLIEMNLYFNEEDGINGMPVEMTLPNGTKTTYYMNGLRSLIAQFKLTPFLPIENRYINKVLNIEAVTMVGLSVNTIPGYPKCIQATLTLQEFNYRVYMPELPVPTYDDEDSWKQNTFARCIHYPVMRWYYQRLLQKGNELENLEANDPEYISKTFGESTPLVPMQFLTPKVKFYMPSREHMDQRLNLALETQNKPIRTQIKMTEDMKTYIQSIVPIYDRLNMNYQSQDTKKAIIDFNTNYVAKMNKMYSFSQPPNTDAVETQTPQSYMFVRRDTAFRAFARGIQVISFDDLLIQRNASNASDLLNLESPDSILERITSNIIGSSTYGIGTKKVELKTLENNKGIYQHVFYLPLPVILDTNQKLEFFKHIISELQITSIDEVIERDKYDKECVKVILKASYVSTGYNQYLNGALELDRSCPGYKFLEYCKTYYKTIVTDKVGEDIEFDSDSTVMQDYAEELYDQNRLESPESIPFEEIDLGDEVIIESMSCHYTNSLARIQLAMEDGYAHQYCGGQDTMIEMSITTKSESAATVLNLLPRLSSMYVRDYRLIMNFWPLRIDSEITKIFGVNEVVVESSDIKTIPNFPGVYNVILRFTAVDRTTRNREALKKLEDINNSGSVSDGVQNSIDTKNYFDLERALGSAEIYPDLELPTIDELNYIGYVVERYTKTDAPSNRVFVDPDFYFVYGYTLGHEIVRDAILRGLKELSLDSAIADQAGAEYILSAQAGKPYKISSKNDSAELIEKELESIIQLMPYERYKKLRNQNVYKKQKIKDNLSSSIASLRTKFWNISEDIRFALREEEYTVVEEDTDQTYIDQIQRYEDAIIEKIDNMLNEPIKETGLRRSPSDIQDSVSEYVGTVTNRDLIVTDNDNDIFWMSELFESKLWNSIPNKYGSLVRGIMNAAADATVGKSYMFKTLTNIADTDIEKESKNDWKATCYNYYDRWNKDKIIPHCKVRVPNDPERINAISFEDGVEYGYAFGIFQIPMLPKETILAIIDKEDKEQINLIKNYKGANGLFLDPYYRNLQLTNPDSEELKDYKYYLMSSAQYCTAAFIRNMYVWYKVLLTNNIALSVYETVRESALKGWKKGDDVSEIKDLNSLAQKDYITYWFLTTYIGLLSEYYEGFKKNYKDEEWLKENGIPASLWEYIKSKSSGTKLKNVISHLEQMKDTDPEENNYVSTEQVETANYLLSIIERAEEDQAVIIAFGTKVAMYTSQLLADLKINYASAESIKDQLKDDEFRLYVGRIFTCAMLAIGNGETIFPMLYNRDVNALDNLLLTLPLPNDETEVSVLKKFILALDGRDVIKTEVLSSKTETAEDLMQKAIAERVWISYSEDPQMFIRDSFFDMIKNDKRGRMLRAFPCYYMLFIDEGRKIGLWRIHDNFYNMNAISELNITKSRKIAADTAHIVMTNMFKTYTTEEETVDLEGRELSNIRYNIKDAFNSIFSPRTYYMQEELRRMQEISPTKAALKPGIRIHLRLGYGADASELPIVFNGVVAEVGAGEMVEIVAQGDGTELTNPLMDVDDASDVENEEQFVLFRMFSNWLENGATPKQLLTMVLTTEGKWLQKTIRKWSNGRFFNSNPYGIVHFGDPKYTVTFANGEVAQNIYEATSRASWGNSDTLSGLEPNYDTGEAPRISMHMFGKSYWDLMHICSLTQHDYIASIAPFGLRSTIFYGAGRYYYAYDYEKEGDKVKEKRKPFQQYHIYSSFGDIIHNNIKASAKDVKTCAVGLYQQNGWFGSESTKQVGPLWVDHDIYPEFQKTMTVDTQFWARGLPIVGNMFGIAASLSKDVDGIIPGAKEIAWRMTATSLKNAIKDMYQGEITVIGDPSVKPYDRMWISDIYEQMEGNCEVEAVVHSFNASTGFTTSLYADCVACVDDKYEQFTAAVSSNVVGTAITAMVASSITNRLFGTAGRPLISAMGIEASKATMRAGKMVNNLANFLSDSDLKIADKFIDGSDFIKKNIVAGSNGKLMSARAYYAVDAFSSANKRLLGLSDEVISTFQALSNQLDGISKSLIDLDPEGCIKDIDKHIAELSKDGDKYADQIKALTEIRDEVSNITKNTDDVLDAMFNNKAEIKEILKLFPEEMDEYTKAAKEALEEFAQKDVKINSKNMKKFKNAMKIAGNAVENADDIIKKAPNIAKAAGDVKDLANIAEGAVKLSKTDKFKDAFKVIIGAAGGWVTVAYMVAEIILWEVLAGYASEWLQRTLQNLEVLQIYPMRRKGRVMVAGINGHKGSVVGSPTHGMQGEWTEFLSSIFDGEGDSLANMVISMFTDERTKEIAKNLRRERNIPDSTLSDEEVRQGIQKQVAQVYTKKAYTNANNLIFANRIKTLSDEESDMIMREYLLLPYSDTNPASRDLQEYTYPIQKHPAIAPYIEKQFLVMYTEDLKEHVSLNFESEQCTVGYMRMAEGIFNVPVLRADAMKLLTDAIEMIWDDLNMDSYHYVTEEREQLPQVFLTSATIAGDASWEGTGLAFRLNVPHESYDMAKMASNLQKMYEDQGAPDFMVAKKVNNQEYVFLVKPLKPIS